MTNAWLQRGVMIGLTLLFGLAGAAWAADCGDTSGLGGTDVSCNCGDSVTTDTRLTSADPVVFTGPGDTVCSGDGLVMNTSGVRLNLGGNEIRGDQDPGDAGIRILSGVNDVEVRNGSITRFGTGLTTEGVTSESTIRNLRIVKNTDDGMAACMTDGFVISNRVSQNGANGILVFGTGNDIDRNQARNNGDDGVCVINDVCVAPGPPNIDTKRNVGKDNGADGPCGSQCEIDGAPCKKE